MGRRPKETFLQRRHTDKWQVHERCSTALHTRGMQSKLQWGTTLHLSEWPPLKSQQINAANVWRKKSFPTL